MLHITQYITLRATDRIVLLLLFFDSSVHNITRSIERILNCGLRDIFNFQKPTVNYILYFLIQ